MDALRRPLRIIFAGTPEFARQALEGLHGAGHTIALVLSQPDRPAGRGLKLQASAVKQFAQEHGIAVSQPRSLRLDGKYPEDAAMARQAIAEARADVMVVAAYGLILPQWVLDDMAAPHASGGARYGCLNIHGSLLPRWRGAAPIHRAIESGDADTGVTIMQMDAGLDTGNILLMQSLPIAAADTTGTLHDKVAALGAGMLLRTLDLAAQGALQPLPQPEADVTYAHKIEKHEAPLCWADDATRIVRRIRAFNPFPGATAVLHGETLKVWGAAIGGDTTTADCGRIVAVSADAIAVAALNSIVLLTELQRPGGRRMPVSDFLRGVPVEVGAQFELSSRQLPGA